MSQVSGDAADRAFKLIIDGVEVMVKLTGAGAKNLAVMLYAHYKGDKKLKGATNLDNLLRSGKELRIFRLDENDLKAFKVQAKKYGVLFCAVKDTQADDGFCDLFIKAEDIPKVNHVLGRMDYDKLSHEQEPVKEQPEPENEAPKKDSQQRNSSDMQESSSKQNEKTKVDVEQVVRDLNANKAEAMTPENWKAYLALNSQMYSYSQRNKERILEQNPGASVVMSKSKWRKLGRFPKQGAAGIFITMPEIIDGNRTGNFVDVKVFDISETYGRDISKSKITIQLKDGSPEMETEIERLKTTAPVPVETMDNLETDSFYNADEKKIFIRSDIPDSEVYKGLCREITYANEHIKQGAEYDRIDSRLMAESIAYSMAYRYDLDTSDFRFDCIPDQINGLDGKDVSELIDPIMIASNNEIKRAENNLSRFKPAEQQPSVKQELQTHKSAVDTEKYKTKVPVIVPVKTEKGRER